MRGFVSSVASLLLTAALSATASAQADPASAEKPEALELVRERGPVSAKLRLEPGEPRIGDPLRLSLTVTAESGVELLMPEFGRSLERFRVIDFVPRDRVDADGRTVSEQIYTLEVPGSGEHAIPPIIVEFVDHRDGKPKAPEGEDAFELTTDRLPFAVTSVVPEPAAADLEPPLGELELRYERGPVAWIAAGLLGVGLLGAGIVFVLRRSRRAPSVSAYEKARAALDALLARPRPSPEQADAFFVELSTLVRDYLEGRFELRAPELTTEEFLVEAGASPDLSRDHQALLQDFLRRADMVKFARVIPGADDIESAIESASRFLDETGREDGERSDRETEQADAA